MPKNTKPANRLLAALPPEEYRHLLPKLEEVPLLFSETIYKANSFIRGIYFPNSGIVSLLAAAGERSPLEVGIIGNEGFVGLPVFLGVKKSNARVIVQGAGAAMRMETADFTEQCRGGTLPQILRRYTHALMTQISQSAVCSRFHDIESRLARWLLMTGDRMASNDFQITQEFLSNMLGVRREAVTLSAKKLQQNELIVYSRGKMSILDRAGLEAAACRCYFIIKKETENASASFRTI